MKCLIVDDQLHARELAAKYVSEIPGLELAGVCEGPVGALKFLEEDNIDLLLLDMEMPVLNGFELLKTLKKPPLVIVISGYSEFALEGYRWQIVDFILKPLSLDKLLMGVNKAKDRFTASQPTTGLKVKRHFFVRQDHKMVKVRLSDILFIESFREYIHIHTKPHKYVIKKSLTALELELPEKAFVRTHRSFIVHLDKVDGWYGNVLQLDDHEVPIGKLYRENLMKLLRTL